MRCEEAAELLGALADGELEPARRADAEAHAAACAACAADLQALRALSAAVRAGAPYHRAPADLRVRIGRGLRGAQAPALLSWRSRLAPGLAGAAAGFACALFVLRPAASIAPPLDETVSAHIRAMTSDRLVAVESTDHHTVKPWFSRHVDFSPPVPDLAAAGFPLKGGRVETYGGRTAAVSVYARGLHVIDVFNWPEPGADTDPASAVEQRGYRVLSWRAGGFGYRAVSDLNARELTEFAALLRREALRSL